MLTERDLSALEELPTHRGNATVPARVLGTLIAAARVANAAAHRRRCDWDRAACAHLESASYAASRALDRYTQPQPQKVNP